MNSKPTRRTFFVGAGVTLAAPVGITAALPSYGEDSGDRTALLAALDDSNAIRVVLQRYVRLVSAGAHAELAELFADAASAAIDSSIRSLASDAEANVALTATDTATARLACTVNTATPIESCGTLVEMARLQGDGFVARSERRVLASSFVKIDGTWKIQRTEWLS
jgi:hypothetical protein